MRGSVGLIRMLWMGLIQASEDRVLETEMTDVVIVKGAHTLALAYGPDILKSSKLKISELYEDPYQAATLPASNK